MITVKTDFENRKAEIDEYFGFVDIIYSEEKEAVVNYKRLVSHRRKQKFDISDKLQKVLIANGFLLLYNLIEATIRNSLCEIFDEIQFEEIDYNKLSKKLKKVFLKQTNSNLKEGSFSIKRLNDQVFDITMNVINEEVVYFSKEKLDFSGNLDARKIRDIAESYGFNQPIINGDSLLTIKTKRNHLAHGDFSFSDIGRDYSIRDLIDFKSNTFAYLTEVISSIEGFLDSKLYLVIIEDELI